MNSNLEIAVILLNITNFFFVFLLIFNLFKVNYFNPIVIIFVLLYTLLVLFELNSLYS